ncbi:sulfotransferase family 2 domain-containing protein [Sulfurovum lithotrophicum]|uniref:sulfotransferase family 2 domain-containing protein n=1 Tax=Sulfurovum lithotrophicum TaxID=206403 RepID=UPI000698C21C|nr:sulfotransferase family 2 domain-containing protein [Sulfurovum lithotrophicum]
MKEKKISIFKPYNDLCKCIYIHIPKVAGISIEEALFREKVGHKWALMYKGEDKQKFNDYFKFSFVRNPYDRLASAFFFLKNGGRNEFDKKWSEENLSAIEDFTHFIQNLQNEVFREKVLKWTHFIPQYKYVCDQKGEIIVDYIGKFETLHNDFSHVADTLGIPVHLSHQNKTSNKKDYRTLYTEDMQETVYRLYQKDFELFDYDFHIG